MENRNIAKKEKNDNKFSRLSYFCKRSRKRIKYGYKYFALSMRRKVGIDFALLYVLISIIIAVLFTMSFHVYKVNEQTNIIVEKVSESYIKYEDTYKEILDLEKLLDNNSFVSIELQKWKKNKEKPYYKVEYISNDKIDFQMNIPEMIEVFFKEGIVKQNRWINNKDERVELVILQDLEEFKSEWQYLLITIILAQSLGLLILILVGTTRLKTVFRPIYKITKMAEKISIDNMEAHLDVAKAEYELKDLVITINDMLQRIREDYNKQKRFVSDVSHELRTPISILSGYARMLDRWGKEDKEILDEAIIAIKDESRNMQTLVEGLLILVRFDNQTLKFEKEEFDIGILTKEICKDMKMIDEGKHNFSHDIESSLNVRLDYSKIKQTLRIFIDNAIKYTPEGGNIYINVRKINKMIAISIKDTGIGIEKKDLPFLFDRFYRSDTSRTRETGGHGLGLSIAKAIVIGQNGTLYVKSMENIGSTFTITLPLSSSNILM